MNKKIFIGLLVVLVFIAVTVASWAVYEWPFRLNYAPEQPIFFSHKVHAGDNDIPCQYCHLYARRAKVAGIPPVQTCYNCHKHIPGTNRKVADSEKTYKGEIDKVLAYWKKQEPIPWIKVFDVPDFVNFGHKYHVTWAHKKCRECHGPIETMNRVKRSTFLNMGFCVQCHRKNGANDDCTVCHK